MQQASLSSPQDDQRGYMDIKKGFIPSSSQFCEQQTVQKSQQCEQQQQQHHRLSTKTNDGSDTSSQDSSYSSTKKESKLKADFNNSEYGIKSRPIKHIKHPLERCIASFFFLTLFFILLAVITGIPTVIVLTIILIPAYFLQKLFMCLCKSLPPSMSYLTPLESFWISNKLANNYRQGCSTCILYLDGGLSIEHLRDVVMARVVQKPEMSRFRSVIKHKGLFKTPVWVRLAVDEFSIEKQIVEDKTITDRSELKRHLLHISTMKMPDSLPPWQIRRCFAPYLNQVILIIRIHQCLIDGVGLAQILVQYLADQSPPKTTTFIRTTQGTSAMTSYFKPHFGGINFTINLFRAAIIGPLTFILWLIWSFTKRKGNYLKGFTELTVNPSSLSSLEDASMINNVSSSCNRSSSSSKSRKSCAFKCDRSIYWTQVDLAKVNRIKQVTRCCLNDVIMAAIAGAIRHCMVVKEGIVNPPDIGASMPVDIRSVNDVDGNIVGVNFVMLTSPLPTKVEGAIPRLWEVRHLMEELKTSADPAVMFGAHFFLHYLLPTRLARFILNLVHRNSSISQANLQGPQQAITIGSYRLHRILYLMSPPPSVSIAFNAISYDGKLWITVSTTSKLLPCAKRLCKKFKCQMEVLSELLSKRRVPGEVRTRKTQQRSPQYVLDVPFSEEPTFTQDLAAKLNQVQLERFYMSEMLESSPSNRDDIEYRLEELKGEFTDLMKQLRRRKSMAEYGMHNIVINIEESIDEDDMDGELRPPSSRRFSFASRRSSVVSAISIPSSRFMQSSPPHISRRFVPTPSEPSSPSDAFIKEETV